MSSKIKVDTIENVAGSGNVSLGSGHNLVVPGTLAITGTSTLTGNTTVGGTLGVTGTATLSGNATIGTNSGDTRFSLNSANQYTMVLRNAGNIAGQIGGGGTDDLRFSNAAGATTMQVKDGRVLKPLHPCFSVRGANSGSQNMTASDYIAFRNVQTVHTNVGSHFDSSTGRFTAPIAGNYLFGFAFRYDGMGASYFYASIYKNGNTYMSRQLSTVTGAYLHATTSAIVPLSASDYVTVNCRSNSDSSVTLDGDSNFYGFLLG